MPFIVLLMLLSRRHVFADDRQGMLRRAIAKPRLQDPVTIILQDMTAAVLRLLLARQMCRAKWYNIGESK